MSGEGIVTLLFLWAAWSILKRFRKVLLERRAAPAPDSGPSGSAGVSTDRSVPLPDPGFQDLPLDRERAVRPGRRQKRIPVAGATNRLNKRQQLRRAVVWAELLAPPVGLRKE
ncbi:MAG: hypothetical protein L3J03_05070 [Desulfobacterales bacterium]|nr:hypothetical protein [Desulfobacterales bacterium]